MVIQVKRRKYHRRARPTQTRPHTTTTIVGDIHNITTSGRSEFDVVTLFRYGGCKSSPRRRVSIMQSSIDESVANLTTDGEHVFLDFGGIPSLLKECFWCHKMSQDVSYRLVQDLF